MKTTKKCYQCQEEKPFSEFHKHKNEIYGLKNQCKKCCKVNRAAHYKENKTRENDLAKIYKAIHKEEINESTRKYVNCKREKLKAALVELLGGKCELCGYDKCEQALDFHHRDAASKSFTIGSAMRIAGVTQNMLEQEARKCALLCCRCHREVHAGISNLLSGPC